MDIGVAGGTGGARGCLGGAGGTAFCLGVLGVWGIRVEGTVVEVSGEDGHSSLLLGSGSLSP